MASFSPNLSPKYFIHWVNLNHQVECNTFFLPCTYSALQYLKYCHVCLHNIALSLEVFHVLCHQSKWKINEQFIKNLSRYGFCHSTFWYCLMQIEPVHLNSTSSIVQALWGCHPGAKPRFRKFFFKLFCKTLTHCTVYYCRLFDLTATSIALAGKYFEWKDNSLANKFES